MLISRFKESIEFGVEFAPLKLCQLEIKTLDDPLKKLVTFRSEDFKDIRDSLGREVSPLKKNATFISPFNSFSTFQRRGLNQLPVF